MTEMAENQNEIEKAKKILNSFARSIIDATSVINDNFLKAIQSIYFCKGKVVTTGVGKAGIIMQKFSATLCSTGTVSCFMHPGEAMHGDLDVLTPSDILFVASTSGKTREILEVLALAKSIPVCQIIGVTSHLDSPLRKEADILIDIGVIKEVGEVGLAPTNSTAVMLALTDCLAIMVSEKKGFSKEDFAKFHHDGYIGSIARGELEGK